MGAVLKVRFGEKNTVIVKIATFFARYDSGTNIGNTSVYGLQKYYLKQGLSVQIKNKGRSKRQLYMQNTIFCLDPNDWSIFLLDLIISLRKAVYLHIICDSI